MDPIGVGSLQELDKPLENPERWGKQGRRRRVDADYEGFLEFGVVVVGLSSSSLAMTTIVAFVVVIIVFSPNPVEGVFQDQHVVVEPRGNARFPPI